MGPSRASQRPFAVEMLHLYISVPFFRIRSVTRGRASADRQSVPYISKAQPGQWIEEAKFMMR